MKLEVVKINDLKPLEKNVRKHNDKQIDELIKSVEQFGQTRAMVIDEDNNILIGNGLYFALVKMNKADVQCYRKTGLSEVEKKKLILSDNKIYSLGADNYDEINNYNPNKVSEQNLELLVQSILTNGWTMPIVIRPDYTIIDGFHRWTVSGREPLKTLLKNKVPVVIVDHKDHAEDVYGTITHNRARGTHLLEPMKAIVKELLDEGKTTKEICKELGMKPEEVFRLSDFTREDFLKIMIKDQKTYNKSYQIKNLK